jgi:hypothetical protein
VKWEAQLGGRYYHYPREYDGVLFEDGAGARQKRKLNFSENQ